MKSVKSKRNTNSSFLSNHDLLQNFRNKSFKLITRETSVSQLKNMPKKVSLIQKKSYESKQKQNKQNDPNLTNRNKGLSKATTLRQKTCTQLDLQLQKVIKQLNFIYDSVNSQEIQLRMILNKNIRRIKQISSSKIFKQSDPQKQLAKNEQQKQIQIKQKIDFLQNKIQQQSKKILKYKKQNDDFKEKIQLYERKIMKLQEKLQKDLKNFSQDNQIRNFGKNQYQSFQQLGKMFFHNKKKPSNSLQQSIKLITENKNRFEESKHEQFGNKMDILQKIIQGQQELINTQVEEFIDEKNEWYKILKSQAMGLEEVLQGDKNKGYKQNQGIKDYQAMIKNVNCVKKQQIALLENLQHHNNFHQNITRRNLTTYHEPVSTKSSISEAKYFHYDKPSKSPLISKSPIKVFNSYKSSSFIEPMIMNGIKDKMKRNNQFSICLY